MARTLTSSPTRRADLVSFLGALCMFLSAIEYIIPKPIPFLRVGIANLPILISVDLLPVPFLLLVVVLKVIVQGLVGGTLFSYVLLFCAAGFFSSALAMLHARRLFSVRILLVGVSVIRALIGNTAQILLAAALLGAFSEGFTARSAWWAEICRSG